MRRKREEREALAAASRAARQIMAGVRLLGVRAAESRRSERGTETLHDAPIEDRGRAPEHQDES